MTTNPAPACRNCLDTGHVCDDHPDRPWAGMLADNHPHACPCGSAIGRPCPTCCDPTPLDRSRRRIGDAFTPRTPRSPAPQPRKDQM